MIFAVMKSIKYTTLLCFLPLQLAIGCYALPHVPKGTTQAPTSSTQDFQKVMKCQAKCEVSNDKLLLIANTNQLMLVRFIETRNFHLFFSKKNSYGHQEPFLIHQPSNPWGRTNGSKLVKTGSFSYQIGKMKFTSVHIGHQKSNGF